MAETTWSCYHCGAPAEEGATSCPACRESLVELCACGESRSRLLRHCPQCGRRIRRRRLAVRRFRILNRHRRLLIGLVVLAGIVLLVSNILISIPQPRGERIAAGIAKARAALKVDEPREAVIHLENVLRIDGENTQALELLALALERMGENAVALARAREAVAIDSRCGVAQIIIARSLIRTGKYEEARQRAMLALDSIDAGARYLLGRISRAVGDLRGAIDELKRVPDGDPFKVHALLDLGDIYLAHPSGGYRADAKVAFEDARQRCLEPLGVQPNNTVLLLQAARAEVGLGRHNEAIQRLRTILDLTGDDRRLRLARIEARLRIIRVYADHVKDLDEARNHAEILIEERGDPRAYMALARVHRLRGEDPLARSRIQEGIARNPTDASLRAALVLDLVRTGDLEEARRKAVTGRAETVDHPEMCVAHARVLEAILEREEEDAARQALGQEIAAAYAKALERDAQNVRLRRRLVDLLLPSILATGDPDAPAEPRDEVERAALDSVDWILKLRDEDPQASYWRGRLRLRSAGSDPVALNRAAEDLAVAARGYRDDIDVLRWLGHAWNRAAEPMRAARAYQAAVLALPADVGPEGARLYVLLAEACLDGNAVQKQMDGPGGSRGYVSGALEACREALARWPDGPERLALLRLQGRALMRARRPREALAAARAAWELEPTDVEALLLHGIALDANGRPEEAEQMLVEAVVRQPGLRTRTALAEHYGRRGQLEKAEEEFQALFSESPGNAEVLVAFGDFLLRKGDFDRAVEEYRKAATRASNSVVPIIRLADALLGAREDQRAEVRRLMLRARELDPEHPDVLAMDGRLLLRDGKPEDAARLLEKAVAAMPRNAGALYYLGRARFDLRDLDEAKRSLDKALMWDPGLTPAKLLLARIELAQGYQLYRQHRSEAAQKRFLAALSLDPDLPAARVLLADTYLDLGQQDLSREEITRSLAAIPEDRVSDRAAAYFLLGFAAKNEAKKASDPVAADALRDEAILAFGNVVQLEPANWAGHFQMGIVYEEKGATDNALRSFELARRNAPGEPRVVWRIVRILAGEGRDEIARELLRKQTEAFPDAAEYPHMLGDLLRQFGQPDAANRAYAMARARDPDDVEAVLTPARILLRRGRSDEARDLVREWIPRARESKGALHRWLGEVAFERGEFEVAAGRLREALNCGEEDPRASVRLGQALERLGKQEDAISAYTRALDMGLDDDVVVRQLADLLMMAGQSRAAIGRYEVLLEKQPDDIELMNNLAFALADERRDLDRALELAKRVREALPDAPAVQDTLGWVTLRRGDSETALALFRQALRRAPADPTIRFHEALALRATGQEEKARKALRSLQMDPKLTRRMQTRIRHELRPR
jgi:tetratricopeptide (TPR) repeat protein